MASDSGKGQEQAGPDPAGAASGAASGLTPAQKRALLARLVAQEKARTPVAAEDVVALFARQAAQTPDAIAVEMGEDRFTYGALNARAAAYAEALQAAGAGPGAVVGLDLPRGVGAIAGLLGILKAGAGYVPLEAEDAPARHQRLRTSAHLLLSEDSPECLRPVPAAEPLLALLAPDRAPCPVPRRAVAERLAWLRQAFDLGPDDTSLFAGSLHDISTVASLLWPLTVGARVALAPVEHDPRTLAALARERGATFAVLPAGALRDLRDSRLRLVFLLDEPAAAPEGPPEAAIYTLWQFAEAGGPVLAQPLGTGAPRIGAPLHILDRNRQPVPAGGVGALAVTSVPGGPMEVVAARARQRADGRFERRADTERSAAVAGLRFSLANVEAELRGAPDLAQCRVLARPDPHGGMHLVAYAVPQGYPDRAAWCAHAAATLPPWQRPVAWVAVSVLPLTPLGEVDDAALARLAVPEPWVSEAWAARLGQIEGVAEAAVVEQARVVEDREVRLSVCAPVAAPAVLAPSEAPSAPAGPPALADGGPLVLPADAPRTLTDALLRTAAQAGDRDILFHGADAGAGRRLSYADLLEEARRIAGGLRAAGLRAGDVAILQFPDLRAHLPAFWGCVLAGVQPVTVAVSATFADRTALVGKLLNAWEALGRPVLLAPVALAAPLAGLARFTDEAPQVLAREDLATHAPLETPHVAVPEDVLFLQLSSGSTGTPKCIQITHGGVVAHIQATRLVNGYGADDVSLNWLPMDHVVPMLTWHLRDVYLGCRQIQVETAAVLADPLLWLDLMAEHGVTRSWSPNFGFKLVADALAAAPGRAWALNGVKTLMNAGEQATWPVIADFLARTAPLGLEPQAMQPAFGMAEACTCMTYETPFDPEHSVQWIDKAALGGVLRAAAAEAPDAVAFVRLGPPVPGVAIRIVDGAGAGVPEGVIGRFQIKGAVITPGYRNNPAANAEAFVGDGWFNSGDLGFIRDGHLTLTGREKELIIVNGANFYCYEIEDVVNAVPGVQPTFAAACGIPDPASGSEALALFFSSRAGADAAAVADAIRAAVTARLGLAPVHVGAIPAEDFPKTTSGKIQRMQLRAQLLAARAASGSARTVPAWFHRETWVRRTLDAASVPPRALLLLGGAAEVAGPLAQALERAGGRVIARAVEASADALLSAPAELDGVVDLRALMPVPAGESVSAFRARAEAELAQALALVQQLARRDGTPPALLMLTRGGVDGDPARTALRGLLRTAGQERPGLTCRQLDVAGDLDEAMVGRLAQEILAPDGEAEVALRPAGRFVPRLEALDPGATPGVAPIRLTVGGRYLITGGLGGIGRALAAHLAARCRAQIVMVGRAAGDPGALSALAAAAPGSLYQRADVTDPAALEVALAAAEARFGGPLDGAFHLAGVASEAPLATETAAGLMAAFAPKAIGARVVLEAMARRPGGFVAVWSSVNALFGGTAAGAYSAANAALAGLTPPDGVRLLCLHWSRWQGLGMSADATAAGEDRGAFAAARGFRTLPVADALASLDAALALGLPSLSIGLDGRHPALRTRMADQAEPLFGLAGFMVPRTGIALAPPAHDDVRDRFGTPVPCALRVIAALPRHADGRIDTEALARHDGGAMAARARDPVEMQLAALWSELLHRPHPAPDDNFFTSGGHSLVAARLVYRVREMFGVDLPLRILFEAPTLAGMAGWISAHLPKGAGTRQIPDCLVPVQPEGEKPALFCVHPAGGSPWCYLFLAEHLGRAQPVYGFQAPGLVDDKPPLTSVEAIARLYVEAMRAQQPRGPYRIAAWSSGGPVAFEMARVLEAAGETVATLAFLDCAVMETDNLVRSRDPLRHVKGLWRIGTFVSQVRLPRSYGEVVALARLIGLSLPASLRDLRLDRAFWSGIGRSMRIFNLNTTMGYRYSPARLTGDAVLFRAGASAGANDPLEAELRRHVSGAVVRVDLEGTHMSMILSPEGAAALAVRLKPFLDGEAPDPSAPRPAAAGSPPA